MLALVFLLFITQLITAKTGAVECPFEFIFQPPTQLNCNPLKYNRWKLMISCSVRSTHPIQYEIHWFQKKRNNTIIEHGRVMPVYYKTTYEEKGFFGQSWEGQYFRNDMLGDYWCQVKLTDREPPQYLSKSNILTVREPDYYNSSLPTCDKKQYVIEKECIGNSSLISYYSRTLSASPMASQTQSSILPTSTMQTSSLSKATIKPIVPYLSTTTASRSKLLISSPTPTVTTENKNGMNIFLIGIVTLSIILILVVLIFLIIILAVIIKCKRKKMILLVLNQTNDETKRQENKTNTIIEPREQDGSSYPSQNPHYQPLTVTNKNYVSIYDNINEGNIPSVRINEELPLQSQRNNELENNTDRTSINTTEPYYIDLDESSLASYYTIQDPDGQIISVQDPDSEIISVYDDIIRSGVPMVNIKDHKYINFNSSLVDNSVYTMRFLSHKTN